MAVKDLRGRKLVEAYPIGSIVTVERGFCGSDNFGLAIVYEHYVIGRDHYGISLVNEVGGYDGFSQDDLTLFGVTPTGYVASEMASFEFKQVGQLHQLHQRGVLDKVFHDYRQQVKL